MAGLNQNKTKSSKRKSLERIAEKQVLLYLSSLGWVVWSTKAQGTYDAEIGAYRANSCGNKSTADIQGFTDKGRAVQIEMKTTSHLDKIERGLKVDERTQGQINFINKAKSCCVIAFFCDSVERCKQEIAKCI